MQKVADYAYKGGTVAFMMHPAMEDGGGDVPTVCQDMAGFSLVGGAKSVLGISLQTDFLFAGKGFSFGEGTQCIRSITLGGYSTYFRVGWQSLAMGTCLWAGKMFGL